MHGAFIVGLKEFIINRFDESFWEEILEFAEVEPSFHPLSNQEIDDAKSMALIKGAVKKLNVNDRQFGEMFGNYWIKVFAREKYFAFFDAYKSSKDFIEHLTELHKKITSNLKRHVSPVFDVSWENPHSAIINYVSKRGLIHIAVGLLKALGDYYGDEISVYRVDANRIKIFFKAELT